MDTELENITTTEEENTAQEETPENKPITEETERFQVIATKVDNRYIVLADGLESELSDIVGIIKEILGENEMFMIAVDKEEYTEKSKFIDLLNEYIDSKVKA